VACCCEHGNEPSVSIEGGIYSYTLMCLSSPNNFRTNWRNWYEHHATGCYTLALFNFLAFSSNICLNEELNERASL
jgi:hypothetical protein